MAERVERLTPLVADEEGLAETLAGLQEDASFRMIGDMPIKPLLGLLGWGTEATQKETGADPADILTG